jgi:hypothetical protein
MEQAETSEMTKDSIYTYYETKTNAFSLLQLPSG